MLVNTNQKYYNLFIVELKQYCSIEAINNKVVITSGMHAGHVAACKTDNGYLIDNTLRQ